VEVKVLGPGCANCVKLDKLVHEVVASMGLNADIEKVTDYGRIASYGVLRTPGLVVDGKVVCYGRVPSADEVKQWLTKAQ
jgi:small redox-active disulfide protein 2